MPPAGMVVPPTCTTTPPAGLALPFLSAPPALLDGIPATTGLFFLLPPPLGFLFADVTTVTVPPISGEICVDGSSSWLSTRGKFFSPRAFALAMASATIRFAFSCLQRISTRRTEEESPGALVMRIACDIGEVVLEGPAVEELMTFTTETAPPAEAAELVCIGKEIILLFLSHQKHQTTRRIIK